MKAKTKVILGSAMTAAMCASLIAGSTFALFTSEAKTNISVTAGKVNVTATLGDAKLYTKFGTEAETEGWLGGSSVTKEGLVDGENLKLANMTPGAGVRVPLHITNESNVAIKYQVRLTSSMEEGSAYDLFDVLQIKADGLSLIKLGQVSATDWAPAAPKEEVLGGEITIDLYLPDTAGNEYESLKGNLAVQVLAVQGNAATTDPSAVKPEDPDAEEKTSYVFDYKQLAGLEEQFSAGETFEGKTVELMDNIHLDGEEWTPIAQKDDGRKFQGIFDGHDHTISGLLVTKGSDGGDAIRPNEFAGLFGDAENAVIKNLTIDGASVTCGRYAGILAGRLDNATLENVHILNSTVNGAHYVGGIAGYNFENVTMKRCSVEGCVVNGTNYINEKPNGNYNTGDKVGGLIGYSYGIEMTDCLVADTEIHAWRDVGTFTGYIASTFTGEKTAGNTVRNTTVFIDHANAEQNQEPDKEINARKFVGSVAKKTEESDRLEAQLEKTNTVEGFKFKLIDLDLAEVSKNTYVGTAAGLAEVADKVNGGKNYAGQTVSLTADIDLQNAVWTPIGTDDHAFSGVFDGNGYTISNLNSVSADGAYWRAGLFGEANPTIKDLTVENVTAKGAQAGALIGHSDGFTLQNVTLGGKIEISYAAHSGESYGSVGLFVGVATRVRETFAVNVKVAADCMASVDIAGTEKSGVNTNDGYQKSGNKLLFGYLKTEERDLEKAVTVEEGAKVVVRNGSAILTLYDADDFAEFRDSVNGKGKFAETAPNPYTGKTVLLMNDIDFKGFGANGNPVAANAWQGRIGDGTVTGVNGGNTNISGNAFSGTFDGQNFTLKNLYMPFDAENPGAALFGILNNATVKDLKLEHVEAGTDGAENATGFGALAVCLWEYNGKAGIENVHIDGLHLYGGSHCGGLVGFALGGTIENCSIRNSTVDGRDCAGNKVDVSVQGSEYIGMLAGNGGADFSQCTVEGCTLLSNADNAGGVIGYWKGGDIMRDITVKDTDIKFESDTLSIFSNVGMVIGYLFRKDAGINLLENITVTACTISAGSDMASTRLSSVGGVVGAVGRYVMGNSGMLTASGAIQVSYRNVQVQDLTFRSQSIQHGSAIIGGRAVYGTYDMRLLTSVKLTFEQCSVQGFGIEADHLTECGYYIGSFSGGMMGETPKTDMVFAFTGGENTYRQTVESLTLFGAAEKEYTTEGALPAAL